MSHHPICPYCGHEFHTKMAFPICPVRSIRTLLQGPGVRTLKRWLLRGLEILFVVYLLALVIAAILG